MGEQVIKMPDIGEGVAEAELVEWEVKVGDQVREDQVLAAVMTDKATVEIPAPREGRIIWLGPDIGEIVAVGSPIIRMEVEGEGNAKPGETSEVIAAAPADADKRDGKDTPSEPESPGEDAREREGVQSDKANTAEPAAAKPEPKPATKTPSSRAPDTGMPRKAGSKPLAPPAVRKRALDAGIDLRRVTGTGPAGRIGHEDLDAFMQAGGAAPPAAGALKPRDTSVEEIKIVGLRRKIAEKMQTAKRRIPHITYVDEVDVSALEDLRTKLNAERRDERPKLTLLPFLMRAMARAIADQPQMNALYDDEANIVRRHGGMHMGVAAQTDKGLVVPVVRHVEALSVWDCAAELNRLAQAAKDGSATRDELTGATITITSLGAMGGIVTTPVIDYPQVAIVGVNKMRIMPVWRDTEFVPRRMMNLSSSFDHRGHRRLGRGGVHPADQGAAGGAGDDLHRGVSVDGTRVRLLFSPPRRGGVGGGGGAKRRSALPRATFAKPHPVTPPLKERGKRNLEAPRPMTDISCDFLVIGAGPGGYIAAIRAGQLGLDTVIVRKRPARRHLPQYRLYPVEGADPRGRRVREGDAVRQRQRHRHFRLETQTRPRKNRRVEGRHRRPADIRRRRSAEEGEGSHRARPRLLRRWQDRAGRGRRIGDHPRQNGVHRHRFRSGRTALPAVRRRRHLLHRGAVAAGTAEASRRRGRGLYRP